MRFDRGVLVVLAVAAACASSRPSSSTGAMPQPGKYAFRESPRGMRGQFEGTFTVIGDTVVVDATPGPCAPAPGNLQSRAQPIVYQCSDLMVYFDRVDPVRRSSFVYNEIVQERKSVCDLYETTPTGQQRCVRSHAEVNDKAVRRTAQLHSFLATP